MKRLIIFAAGALVAATVLADNNEGVGAGAPEADAAVAAAGGDMKIEADLKVGTDVQNRDIVGEGASFPAATQSVVAWTRVTGAAQPTQITHVWKRDGVEISRVPLNIQSASFRTYSRKSVAGLPGAWSVEVLDASGASLAKKDFSVEK